MWTVLGLIEPGSGFFHAEFNLGAHETLDGRGWVKVAPNRARAVGSYTMWHCVGDDVRHDVQLLYMWRARAPRSINR